MVFYVTCKPTGLNQITVLVELKNAQEAIESADTIAVKRHAMTRSTTGI